MTKINLKLGEENQPVSMMTDSIVCIIFFFTMRPQKQRITFSIHPYFAAAILDLKRGWTGLNKLLVYILKMAGAFSFLFISRKLKCTCT